MTRSRGDRRSESPTSHHQDPRQLRRTEVHDLMGDQLQSRCEPSQWEDARLDDRPRNVVTIRRVKSEKENMNPKCSPILTLLP